MVIPQHGDRILIFKEPWLKLILKGEKKMEIRNKGLTGSWWLGCKGEIRGKAIFGQPVMIPDQETWLSLRSQHLVETEDPPYGARTRGLPVLEVRKVKAVKYLHKKGAVGIVRFCAPEAPEP